MSTDYVESAVREMLEYKNHRIESLSDRLAEEVVCRQRLQAEVRDLRDTLAKVRAASQESGHEPAK